MIFLFILTLPVMLFAKSLPNPLQADLVGIGIPTKFDSAKVIFIPDQDVPNEEAERVGAAMEETNDNSNVRQAGLNGFLNKPLGSASDREQLIIISREPVTHVSEVMPENDGSRTFSSLNRGNGRGGLVNGGRGISGIISSLQNLQNIMNNPQNGLLNQHGHSQNIPSRGVSVIPSTISSLNQGSGLIDSSNIPQRVVITNPNSFSTFNRPLQNWQQGSMSSFGTNLFNQGNILDTDSNTPENFGIDDLESLIATTFRHNLPLEKPPKVLNPDIVTLPYLFQFPEYRRSVDDDRWHSMRDSHVQKHSINKRSLPIVKLIHNPNVKLDFPKTIQNLGSATRNSFEDENAPLHHMNNLIGSVKNVFLSTLKIPPQDLIIPSQYKIINSDDIPKLRMNHMIHSDELVSNTYNGSDPYDIISTFQKVGVVFRDSIHSTQEAFGHAGDIAHSARKIIHTSRHSTPRIILPYAKAPAIVPRVSAPQKPKGERVLLIAPKILGVSRDSSKKPPNSFVRVGQIMDALGMSNPNKKKFDTEEIVLQPKKPVKTNLKDKRMRVPNLLKSTNERRNKSYMINTRSGFEDDDEVLKAINTLEAAEEKNGVGNLKDLIAKMKGDLNLLKTKLTEHKNTKKGVKVDTQTSTDKQIDSEVTHLVKNILEEPPKSDNCTTNTTQNGETDEIVGAGLPLAANLLKPFMGRPSRREMVQFLKENGDEVDPNEEDDEIVGDAEQKSSEPLPDVDQVLGAINPIMFEKFLNDSLNTGSNITKTDDEADSILGKIPGEKVRISVDIDKNLLKPFINKPTKENVNNYLEYYNSKFEDTDKIENKDNELS